MTATMPIPDGSVIITPLQMYQEQQEMNKTLQKVATSVESVVGKLDHYQEDQGRRMDAIDGKDGEIPQLKARVSALEQSRWKSTGAIAAGSSLLSSGVVGMIVAKMLGH
jgi:hypothetical protein